jgi:uncharacterized protein
MTSTEGPGRALLDVNVLIAVHDEQHIHHEAAADWLNRNGRWGWATCPLTQNGCVRILSQPNYTHPASLGQVLAMLAQSCSLPSHAFWPDDVSVLDGARFAHGRMHGHRQITGLYLLALAVKHGGRLVTFDAQIPLSAVKGAKAGHLVHL